MADTKYYDAVDENVAPVKSVSFVTDFRKAKISWIICFCSIGPSCITVKKTKVQQQKPDAIHQLRRNWLTHCETGFCGTVRAFKFCERSKKPRKRGEACAAPVPEPRQYPSCLLQALPSAGTVLFFLTF